MTGLPPATARRLVRELQAGRAVGLTVTCTSGPPRRPLRSAHRLADWLRRRYRLAVTVTVLGGGRYDLTPAGPGREFPEGW